MLSKRKLKYIHDECLVHSHAGMITTLDVLELINAVTVMREALVCTKLSIIENAEDTLWCTREFATHCTVVDWIDSTLVQVFGDTSTDGEGV